MSNYSYEAGANFPATLLEKIHYENVSNTLMEQINKIQVLRDSGLHQEAYELAELYKDEIKKVSINNDVINKLFEELRNIEIYALKAQQAIFFNESNKPPELISAGNAWIGSD